MSRLRNTRLSSEVNLPFAMGSTEHVLTLGGEYLYEALNDQGSLRPQSSDPTGNGGLVGFDRSSSKMTARSYALFVEDNIIVGDTTITPGLRFDHHEPSATTSAPA